MRSKYRKQPSSTDRLKCVQELGRFNVSTSDGIIDYDSVFGKPSLMLNEPVAVLIRCERMLFLGIGEVINIHINLETVEQIPLDLLMEDTVSVTFQLMELVPADDQDDPMTKNDWRTNSHIQSTSMKVGGRFVQAVNPTVSTRRVKPFYLFESSVLLALGDSLLSRLRPGDAKFIPSTIQSRNFPYQCSGELNGYSQRYCLQ